MFSGKMSCPQSWLSSYAYACISGNKHDTAKMVCRIFTAAETFLDVVTCKIKQLQNICKDVSEPREVDGPKTFYNVLFYM